MSPEHDSFDPDREPEAGEASRAARPYSIVVGLVFLGVVIFAGINSLTNEGQAVRGLDEGKPLPAQDRSLDFNQRAASCYMPADLDWHEALRFQDQHERENPETAAA